MQLSDITIITAGIPPKVVDNPSKETTTFLTFLLQSQVFNDFVEEFIGARKDSYKNRSISIVIESMNKDLEQLYGDEREEMIKQLDQKLYNFYDDVAPPVQYLASTLRLPFSIGFDFFLLLEFKAFRDLKDPDYPNQFNYIRNIYSNSYPYDVEEDSCNYFQAIGFQYRPDKRELIDWIDKNWESFQEDMSLLPKSPYITTDFRDLELTEEMYQLHKTGLKPAEILEILTDEHKEDTDSIIYDKLSIDFIKTKIKRFRKLLEEKVHYIENPYIIDK